MDRQSQHISQEIRQTLRLSPAQIRFGRILEMTAPEFEDEVTRALEENPALEAVDSDTQLPDDGAESFNETAEQLQRADFRSDEDMPNYMYRQTLHDRDYNTFDPASVEPGEADLSVLEMQLADMDLTPLTRSLCSYVIGNLDSNGYLTRSAEAMADDLAMSESVDVTAEDVRNAIGIVRSLDPAGIGATDLRECLLLQLDRMSARPALGLARRIVKDFFSDIALHNIAKISETTGQSISDVDEAFGLIKSLNPRPGADIEPTSGIDRPRQIIPDFIIDTDSSGKTTVQLGGRVPELRIEASFDTLRATDAAMAFIRERRDNAEQFISMARRRAATLMAVMTAIISLQPTYFKTFERSDLRPMVLRDIAKLTGMDISTVSRAISMKYALTPFGNVALKSLFSEKTGNDPELSAHRLADAIENLISSEDKTNPLTDAAIVEALKTKGMAVARRTVTKYREKAGIPSTHYRKRKS
ncbi:MAG: RNA polymerase factor sigma-54 [Muribaculaceae bacterium]|nr:RNA polymerase factor sigma-54 [Muribaculaceae bacterium]